MKLRYYILTLLTVLVLGVSAILVLLPVPKYQVNPIEINDITATLAKDFDRLGSESFSLPTYSGLDYTVLDNAGNLRAATRRGLSENMIDAIKHGDLMIDIVRNGQVIGKVVFFNNEQAQWQTYQRSLQILVVGVLLVMTAVCGAFFLIIHRRVLRPFQKMRGFAHRVAAGDLNTPLEMDRANVFGAFTESFDLMRSELALAREAERQANQSKKELVASLSHDIKTPVASIKAVSELMAATTQDEKELQQLQMIGMKADQIDVLVTNLFSATLEELDKLTVAPKELPSTLLHELIRNADYRNKATVGSIPECLIIADDIRLAQVLGNIFENSYKYADTAIELAAQLLGERLSLIITDHGKGVPPEELALLCQKFYRGANAEGKSGTGLGLYISRYFMEKMAGELHCENVGGDSAGDADCYGGSGFRVTLVLSLA